MGGPPLLCRRMRFYSCAVTTRRLRRGLKGGFEKCRPQVDLAERVERHPLEVRAGLRARNAVAAVFQIGVRGVHGKYVQISCRRSRCAPPVKKRWQIQSGRPAVTSMASDSFSARARASSAVSLTVTQPPGR